MTIVICRVPEVKPSRIFPNVESKKQVRAINKLYKSKHLLVVELEKGLNTFSIKPFKVRRDIIYDMYLLSMAKRICPSFFILNSILNFKVYRPACLQNVLIKNKMIYNSVIESVI